MDNKKEELNEEIEETTILNATNKDASAAASNDINITDALIIEDCIFYVMNTELMEDQINEIRSYQEQNNGIELCQEMFHRENINYFKFYNETQQIFYKKTNEDEILIEGTSEEYDTLYLKLIKCHTYFIKKELRKENERQEKSDKKELSTDSNDFDVIGGLPSRLISEYARIKSKGRVTGTIKAQNEELPRLNKPCLLIIDSVEKLIQKEVKTQEPTVIQTPISANGTTTKVTTNVGNDNNNKSKSFDGYIMGTPSHVSSFLLKSNIEPKKYYLFDTTGHTHQYAVTVDNKQSLTCYHKTQLQLSDKILSDKDAVSLFTNTNNNGKISMTNLIDVVSLNPFGLDYQNNSSACGIWSSSILAEALEHDEITDCIMEDTEHNFAMFKSEFILKAAARVAREFNGVNPEIQEITQETQQTEKKVNEENSSICKCKIGNTLFLINTQYKSDSCLNMDNILLSIPEEELGPSDNEKNNINNDIINKIREVKSRLNEQLTNITNEIEKEKEKLSAELGAEKSGMVGNSSVIKEKPSVKSVAEKIVSMSRTLRDKKIKQQELKNQMEHAKTMDKLFKQSKRLNNEQLDNKQLLSNEQSDSNQIQNELLDDRQSSNKQLDKKNQIQSEEELKIQQSKQLQSQQLLKENKNQQNMQLEKGGKLDQEKVLPLMERALLEMGEKLDSRNRMK